MIKRFLPSLLTIIAMTSCSQQPDLQDCDNKIRTVLVSADQFEDGDVLSRFDVSINGSKPSFTFQATDTFGIFPQKGDQLSFPLTDDVGKSTCKFDGGSWEVANGIEYYAYIPFDRRNYANENTKEAIRVNYRGQYQTALNDRSGIGRHVYMSTDPVCSESGNLNFQLHHVGALARMGVIIPEAKKYAKIFIKAGAAVFPVEGTYSLPISRDINPTKTSDRVELALNGMDLSDYVGTSQNFWVMFPPANCTSTTLKVVLVDVDGNAWETPVRATSNNNFVAGNYYGFASTADMTSAGTEDPSTESETGNVPFDPNATGDPD